MKLTIAMSVILIELFSLNARCDAMNCERSAGVARGTVLQDISCTKTAPKRIKTGKVKTVTVKFTEDELKKSAGDSRRIQQLAGEHSRAQAGTEFNNMVSEANDS